MCVILPADLSLIESPEVGLVDESGGLQRVTGALTIHCNGGPAGAARLNQRQELV